jgi:hypothetical protein
MAASFRIGLIVGVAVVAAGASIAYVELRDRKSTDGPAVAVEGTSTASAAAASAVEARPASGAASPAAPSHPPPPPPELPPAPAPATPEDEENRIEGAKLLESARTEMTAGRYREALGLLHRAYEAVPEPSTLFDLARMQHLTGECRVARHSAQRVIMDASDAALADKAQRLLDEIGRCD